MDLSEATWTDVRDADAGLALLPVGSTEQHGPHAPLGLDCTTAEAIAREGAARYDGDPLVGPTVPVGVAEEHRAFDGTLWVSPDTFRAYVRETVESLAAHGVDGVVVVNGHGGNADALREVCARLTRDGTCRAAQFTWFDAVSPADLGVDFDDLGHAGPAETSLLRHLAPGLVREDRTDEAADGAADRWGEWVSGTNLAYDSAEFTDSGAVGDPRLGDAAAGEKLLAAAADALAALLERVDADD